MKFPKTYKLKNTAVSEKVLDDLCRKLINLRDKSTCQRCGRNKEQGYKTEWAHFYSRIYKSIRHDPLNSVILCFNCHYNFAHKQPKEFAEWYESFIGKKNMGILKMRRECKRTDKMAVKLFLQQELKKYET